jgi:hypothetical protein
MPDWSDGTAFHELVRAIGSAHRPECIDHAVAGILSQAPIYQDSIIGNLSELIFQRSGLLRTSSVVREAVWQGTERYRSLYNNSETNGNYSRRIASLHGLFLQGLLAARDWRVTAEDLQGYAYRPFRHYAPWHWLHCVRRLLPEYPLFAVELTSTVASLQGADRRRFFGEAPAGVSGIYETYGENTRFLFACLDLPQEEVATLAEALQDLLVRRAA